MGNFYLILNRHWLATLIVTTFVLLATIYSIVTPIFESPDELWHYPFVWRLARTGELPVQDPFQPQLWKQEGSQPPLYYALAALLTAPIPADDLPDLIYDNPHADIGLASPDGNANIVVHTAREAWPWQGAVLALHLTRLLSVLLGSGTVLATYALGRLLWPERPTLALLAMAFVAFNPMFIFISGSVNNDNLIIFLATLTLWQLALLVVRQREPAQLPVRQLIGLGVLTGLASLAKVSGLGLLGLVGLTLLWRGGQQRSWRLAILGNGLVGLIALAIAGWWYGRNVALYGDWTGTQTMVALMGGRPVTPTLAQLLSEIPGLLRSFWGLFGYFSVPMPSPIYWLLNLLLAAGLAGLPVAIWSKKLPPRLYQTWPILGGWPVLIVIGLAHWTLRTPASQGRLLFPALGALAILWAAGWMRLVPPPWRPLPALAWLSLAVWVPWGVIVPAYARPAPIVSLPSSAQPLEAMFGDTVRLLAYEQTSSIAQPGDSLSLTLYWLGEQPTPTDYTVFIHLLDKHDLVVAQRNVFHGRGLYPTSQWAGGQPFADTYTLRIPRTALAPAQTRFEVGLYDHRTGARLPVSTGGDNLRFGRVELQARPGRFPNPQSLKFEEGIWLVGYDLDRQLATAADNVLLTLYWQSDKTPARNYKVFVHLVGSDQTRVAQHDSDPKNGAAPTSSWQPNQPIIDEHSLALRPDAPAGAYQLVVGLYDGDTGQRLRLLQNDGQSVQADSVTLSSIRVMSPEPP